MQVSIEPGRSSPFGASVQSRGVNFSLFSASADKVELCLFQTSEDLREFVRLPMFRNGDVWHGFVPGVSEGQLYGYRVDGPYSPEQGQRFDPNKVLLDPYSKSIAREFKWDPSLFSSDTDSPDSAAVAPLSVVLQDLPPIERGPWVPLEETIIYECHVRGSTILHPDIPEEIRGTYTGLASEAFIVHLKSLGVTAVELLPVHSFVHEQRLIENGLRNYWGYNTLGFFAVHRGYSSTREPGQERAEFREMVGRFHEAGIEVILDVVFNHTAESDHLGPHLSFRGIDNEAYYRLEPDQKGRYTNHSGCGNTLRLESPRVLQMVLDSLRYWVTCFGIDGFRFDLAAALARRGSDFQEDSSFASAIAQDPILRSVKLIAEPWDLGVGGHRTGAFGQSFSEWNDSYRDTMRAFWRGDAVPPRVFAARLFGSDDIFGPSRRTPQASVNFITAHDGFTLHDLVSYSRRHNEANGEGGRDGHGHNLSENFGQEGPTGMEDILNARARQKRNLIATLLLSQGIPMISGGDELGRTQAGNNNAYCQDNLLSYVNWTTKDADSDFLKFFQGLCRIRRSFSLFRSRFFVSADDSEWNVQWFDENANPFQEDHWNVEDLRLFSIVLEANRESWLLVVSRHRNGAGIALPKEGVAWRRLFDTTNSGVDSQPDLRPGGAVYRLRFAAIALFQEDRTIPR